MNCFGFLRKYNLFEALKKSHGKKTTFNILWQYLRIIFCLKIRHDTKVEILIIHLPLLSNSDSGGKANKWVTPTSVQYLFPFPLLSELDSSGRNPFIPLPTRIWIGQKLKMGNRNFHHSLKHKIILNYFFSSSENCICSEMKQGKKEHLHDAQTHCIIPSVGSC